MEMKPPGEEDRETAPRCKTSTSEPDVEVRRKPDIKNRRISQGMTRNARIFLKRALDVVVQPGEN